MSRGIFPRRRAPDTLPPPKHWAVTAVCKTGDVDPDVWFPDPTDVVGIRYAKSLCRHCPVLIECRTEALNRPERHGVWGGLSQREREAVLRKRRAAARAAARAERHAEGVNTDADHLVTA